MADQNIGVRASSVSLGVTVILLYAFFVLLVTFGFGSYIYRTGWQVDNGGGVASTQSSDSEAVDIDNMLFILKREENLERARALLAADIRLFQVEVARLQSEKNQSFAEISRVENAVLIQATLTLADLTDYQYQLPGPARTKFESIAVDETIDPDPKVRALLDVIEVGFEGGAVDAATIDRFVAFRQRTETRFDDLLAATKTANSASHDVQGELALVNEKIRELKDKREEHNQVIQGLKDRLPAASVARARLSALSVSIPFFPDLLTRLVSFPTIFLTLIVTIAAGGLGTVVAFSRRYYSSRDASSLTLSRLFVNVGEGIAAAIAIFLFSGAGMLALTQGGGSVNNVELSPYTVAFVAFLSGFMAEDAFASIQAAGKRIFNTQEDEAEKPPDHAPSGPNLPVVVPETLAAEPDPPTES